LEGAVTELETVVHEVLQSSPIAMQLRDIYAAVKAKAPQLCDDSIFSCPYCKQKHPLWQHKSAWALQRLKQERLIHSSKRGFWEVTSSVGTQPLPIQPPPEEEHVHESLKRKIKEIGEILGRYAKEEYTAKPYVYDVIWKDDEGLPRPSHVFEVQDKGAVDAALAKLQHARDMWRPRLFLVVTGEKDKRKIDMLLGPFLEGTFHAIRRYTSILTGEAVDEIYRALNAHRKVMRSFLEE
jgi:hypothetical protein